jgi:hypothetical protein
MSMLLIIVCSNVLLDIVMKLELELESCFLIVLAQDLRLLTTITMGTSTVLSMITLLDFQSSLATL